MKTVRTVGCFLTYQGRFLILRRNPAKDQPRTWCLASGKVAPGESDVKAVLREIQEETGYQATEELLESLGEFVFDVQEFILHFPAFRIQLAAPINVRLNPEEHIEFAWVTPEECYALPDLIHGFYALLERLGWVTKGG